VTGGESTQVLALFYHSGALGDFLLALPFLKALREVHPERPWHLAVREEHARLVSRIFPFVRRLLPGAFEFAPLAASPPSSSDVAKLLERHGGFFGFIRGAGGIEAAAKRARPRLPVVLAEPFAHATLHGSTIEGLLRSMILRLGLGHRAITPRDFELPGDRLPPLEAAADPLSFVGDVQGKPVALIHVGASGPGKQGPASLYEDVARGLQARGFAVGWVSGPVEVERGRKPPPSPALVAPDLVLLAHAIAASRLYVGNDTGPTHLASALGVATVAIHGVPNPEWRPRGAKSCVAGGTGGFPDAAEVIEAALRLALET
jgi:ADP-heptose:LPS heptosyltransferase